MIHDSFFSQWEQPTSIFSEGHSFVCTLKLKILKDGTVAEATIVKPSGNPIMDQSVLAAAGRVKRIAPLPPGIAEGGAYTINIAFELDQN